MKVKSQHKFRKEFTSENFLIRFLLTLLTSFLMATFVLWVKHGFLTFFSILGDGSLWLEYLSTAGIIAAGLLTLLVYLHFAKRDKSEEIGNIHLVLAIVWSSFGIAILTGVLTGNMYLIPLSLSGLLLAMLVDKKLAIIANVLINQTFFIAYLLLFGKEQAFTVSASLMSGVVGGTFMILLMSRQGSRIKFFLEGLIIGVLNSLVAMLTTVLDVNTTGYAVLYAGAAAAGSSVLSVSLCLILMPIFESAFKIATNFRLLEISSYKSPLLMRLAKEAPGTFNHSMMVANLAELSAMAIGENPNLARAAASYHDVGKLENPQYFVENQKGGYNPHDDLIPEVSVSIITGHTEKGYELLKGSNIPSVIADVAREHHGTTSVNYFYYKVQNITEDMVEREIFSYKGPKPRTKIAAIIMIVDTVEAATRARGIPNTERELREFIRRLIKEKEDMEQFTECGLTFRDAKKIEDALTAALPGMFHSRIDYNKAR